MMLHSPHVTRQEIPWWHSGWLAFALRPDTRTPSAASDAATQRAFEEFFWRFHRQVFGYAWRMLDDEQAAFDITQETFVRAWQQFQQIAAHRDNGAWLFRVAFRLALNHQRQHRRHPSVTLAEEALGASDPGRRVAESDAVQRALARLAPKQRAALVLHEIYGLSCDEIGATLQMTLAAAKMTLFRAREEFRRHYLQGDEYD